MVVLESMALNLAKTIVQKAAAAWIADRRMAEERKKELRALLTPRFRRASPEQRFVDEAASELALFERNEFRGLNDGDRAAALLAVRDAFERADLTDRALFDVDVDAAKLASRLRAGQPRAKTVAGLGEVGGAFYDAALDRCCELYVRAVAQVPTFVGRSLAEVLNRLSDLPDQITARVVKAWREAEAATADPRANADTAVADRVQRLVDERASVLAGRELACAALDAYVAADATGPLVVRAPAGFGKTALLAAWTCRRRADATMVVSHFFAADRDLTSVEDAYRHLLRQIYALAPTLATSLALDADQLHGAVYQALKAWPDHAEGRLVVVVDALDEAREIPASPMFPLPLPERVSVILSTRAGDESDWLVPSLDAWTSPGTALELAPLDRDGLRAWLRLAGDGRLADLATDDIVGQLAPVTAGFPLFVRFLLDDLLSVAAEGGDPGEVVRALTARDVRTEALGEGDVPSGFAPYVRDQFVRIARSGVPRAVESMFALVAVSPGPLPERLVQAGSGLTAFELAALQWPVVRWFAVRASGGEIVYSAAHPLLAREFRKLLSGQATEAEEFLLRCCADWREDATGWALRWFPDLLVRAGRGDELLALARDDAFRHAQLAAYPEQPDLALAAYRAAIRHTAAEPDVVAVSEFMLRHARDVDAMKYDGTPLEALRGGSLEEATRRAALFDPERAPLWTLLLVWELADTGRAQQARDLLDGIRITDLTTHLAGWLARAAMVCASPVATLSPDTVPAMCDRLLDADDGIESNALLGLTWLAEHLVDTGHPHTALALTSPLQSARQNAIRTRIAAYVAERHGTEPAVDWLGPMVYRARDATQAFAAVAVGRARAGDSADARLMFQRAREAADAAGERRDWALSDLAVEQARAGWFAAASTTIAEIGNPFSRSRALESLVTEQARTGHATAQTLEELRRLAADQPDTIIVLRLGSSCLRTGLADDAAATFQRLLAAKRDDELRWEIAHAQLDAGDIEGGYATLRSIDNKNWCYGLAVNLVRAQAEQAGLAAALALLDELRTQGVEPAEAVVSLAEWATETGDGHTARTLLAQALGARPSPAPWKGPAAAEALSSIAATLAGCGRIDDARTVADLITDSSCRDDVLPALAAGLVNHGRVDEALDLVAVADGTWSEGQVLAAVAVALEAKGCHAEAMDATARIDRDRIGVANDALVRMGRAAAAQHRYDDARDCRSRIRSGSISTDPDRDLITSAVAIAQCADGDLNAALATADLLHDDRSLSMCLTGLARTCPGPAALDRIRRRTEPFAPVFRLAPLVAVAAAYHPAGRPEDVQVTLRAAFDQFEALRQSGGGKRASWEYDSDRVAAATADLALELDRARLDDDARRIQDAVVAMPILRRNGLRALFLGYARHGRHDLAQWALKAMDNDFHRGEALRMLISGPQPPSYGDQLVRTALRIQQRSWIPELGHGLAVAGDWVHLTLLLQPAAESLTTACAMAANLAVYAPDRGLELARLIAGTGTATP